MSERRLKITPSSAVTPPPRKPAAKMTISGLHKASPSAQAAGADHPLATTSASATSTNPPCSCHGRCSTTPAPIEPHTSAPQAGDERHTLRIQQMCCPVEEQLIRKRLATLAPVHALDFNLLQRQLSLSLAPGALPMVLAALRELGFAPEVLTASGHAAAPSIRATASKPKQTWWPLGLAALAALGAEVAHWLQTPEWLAATLALLAVTVCGVGTYRKGWQALRHGSLNINALMSLAVTGALLIGQWPEAAMVMVLFSLAERIEARSLAHARDAISSLLCLVPEQVSVLGADGQWQRHNASDVMAGARVRVAPGERIGLDGRVLAGHSSVDQAPITGESLPVEKSVGDEVYAGTINQEGALEFAVTSVASQSQLARIIHAVESAQGAKAPLQRQIDRFAAIYTPAVLTIATLTALLPPVLLGGDWLGWLYKALVLLVIACPCALVISTPVTIVSALAAAARHGILIKGGLYLEQGRRLTTLALDKTGTLTAGRPTLQQLIPLGDLSADQCRQLAASLASGSDHPVSQAIARAHTDTQLLPVSALLALPGRGVQGTINGQRYTLGNHALLHELGLCSAEHEARLLPLEQQGMSVVTLMEEQRLLALFAVADTLRPSSAEAIAELHRLGIRTLMLSGDNPHTVASIAKQAGIDEARCNQLPEDKLQAIAALSEQARTKQEMVGMVGDGINDAPALARADIGFAMGAIGSDAAIETADVALMDDDLRKLPIFIRLSQAAHRILMQNLALALGIKALFLLLTLIGSGTLWMAVFADMGASLLVIGNGLRLLRFRGQPLMP